MTGVQTCALPISDGPVEDPYAPDADVLLRSRQLLLRATDTIVPGHGPAFPAADAPL